MRATGTGNLRIPPAARAEHTPDGHRPARRDAPAPDSDVSRPALPVPLTRSPARAAVRIARTRVSAPFLAQVIAQARPGLSPAREARRRPGPAIEAYLTANDLTAGKGPSPAGRPLDFTEI